jgi:hypothetical protein
MILKTLRQMTEHEGHRRCPSPPQRLSRWLHL